MSNSTVEIDTNLKQKLDKQSKKLGITTIELISRYIEDGLKNQKNKKSSNNISFGKLEKKKTMDSVAGIIKVDKEVDTAAKVVKMRNGGI